MLSHLCCNLPDTQDQFESEDDTEDVTDNHLPDTGGFVIDLESLPRVMYGFGCDPQLRSFREHAKHEPQSH